MSNLQLTDKRYDDLVEQARHALTLLADWAPYVGSRMAAAELLNRLEETLPREVQP